MPQIDRYAFDLKELAAILVRHSGIHEGHWGVFLEFGFGVTSVKIAPEEERIFPAAVASIQKFGILRSDQPNPLTVDAALINPVKLTPPHGRPTRKVIIRKKEQPEQKEK